MCLRSIHAGGVKNGGWTPIDIVMGILCFLCSLVIIIYVLLNKLLINKKEIFRFLFIIVGFIIVGLVLCFVH